MINVTAQRQMKQVSINHGATEEGMRISEGLHPPTYPSQETSQNTRLLDGHRPPLPILTLLPTLLQQRSIF